MWLSSLGMPENLHATAGVAIGLLHVGRKSDEDAPVARPCGQCREDRPLAMAGCACICRARQKAVSV